MYEDPGYGQTEDKGSDVLSDDGVDGQDDLNLNPVKEDSGEASGLSPVR